jgi:glycerol-3-phosphate dehydrogenase (NAD(P)+)
MKGAAVLGAGSWGTALAIHLARAGTVVTLWARRPEAAAAIDAARENAAYLPGCRLPDGVSVTGDLRSALGGAGLVIFAAPAQTTRALAGAAAPHLLPGADLVLASKGLEEGSGLRLSELLAATIPGREDRLAVLSGPSFAVEVVKGDPTAVVVAARDGAAARRVQTAVSHANLRLYTNTDVVGVELCGALKNVMAIATGIVEGIGLGTNTRAALITRGLAEITRLGVALGGKPSTFPGLAGAGDLVLTCTGGLSRNRAVGIAIGRGRTLADVLAGMKMVAEGVPTTRAAIARARTLAIDMPIAAKVGEVLFEGRAPRDAVSDLLARPLREEA